MKTRWRQGKATFEKSSGRKITNPSAYVDPKTAIKMYAANTMENRAAAFYENEGMPIPDFQMMDKIEKLEALNEWREKARNKRDKLRDIDNQEFINYNNVKAKQDAEELAKQHTAGTGQDKGESGNNRKS